MNGMTMKHSHFRISGSAEFSDRTELRQMARKAEQRLRDSGNWETEIDARKEVERRTHVQSSGA